MLRSLHEFLGYKITIEDNDKTGKVDDFLFDDNDWDVQYMVAKTGGWLNSEKRLISHDVFEQPQWEIKSFPIHMTEEEIEDSPEIHADTDTPRRQKIILPVDYSWEFNWVGELHKPEPLPIRAASNTSVQVFQEPAIAETNPSLLSMRDAMSYDIFASNGEVGSLKDFIVDDQEWVIRYLVVDTGSLLPGKKVLVSPSWMDRLDFNRHRMHLDLRKETIREAPEFDPEQPINRKYEEVLYDFYGRPK
jgi:hypothetical protein